MPFDWSSLIPITAASLFGTAVAALAPGRGGSEEAPLRAELLSREQLLDLARSLAADHEGSSAEHRGQPLLRRLDQSAQLLFQAYRDLASAARRGEPVPPAAEWLLDNFHIVEEQLEGIRKHLPKRYYTELPKLTRGAQAGYPRVYALALALIAHSDGAVDDQCLVEVVREYQRVTPLTMGELWAVPIMLRVGLVENLRRLATPMERQRRDRAEADQWADRVIDAATEPEGDVAVVLGELARRRDRLSAAFAIRLFQRLRGRGAAVTPVLDWLERRLVEQTGTGIEELVRIEHQLQAADQVSLSHTITSFRLLDRIDWEAFFEATSHVEKILRRDPSGTYARSDFRTRDACRHEIERLARGSARSETEITEAALALAQAAQTHEPQNSRAGQIAYYLISDGCPLLERQIGYRPDFRRSLRTAMYARPTLTYVGGILAVTAGLLAIAVSYARQNQASGWLITLTVVLSLFPAWELATGLVNWLLIRLLPPRVLPKLDFSQGIPNECRTLVVIPTLLSSEDQVDELLERIEIHYLANQDPNLHFALLTDFTDAAHEEEPRDTALLHRAIQGILDLNARHEGPDAYHRFFLFHRKRVWNASQGVWMGWERKRGKLMELNRLLRGAEDTTFTVNIGDRTPLGGVRYVICLDSDTQLPPDSAHRLVGTLAHPLNRAVIDPQFRRVVQGYGILQPRVSITLTSAARSLFTRVFSGNAGVDPYTTAVSDVYQDLFGEGIFCGKGIYEIDTFETVLDGRVGENQLLSHDLFEGNFARCGLVTDIELFDDYPTRYNTYAARQHRWIRGDWQIMPWIFPWVKDAKGRVGRNTISPIGRWKILDNLRRSLTAFGLLLMLAGAWLWLPGSPLTWTLAALLVVAFPIYAHLANALLIDPRGVPWTSYFWGVWYDVLTNFQQVLLSLVFLAHQAFTSLDAIVRTLWRLFVSRRNLLEWTTAADAERRMGTGPTSFWRRMWPAPAVSVLLLAAISMWRPESLIDAAPVLLAWIASPGIAYWVSLPIREPETTLTDAETDLLRLTARRTWHFFEELTTEQDRWLIPDNYQEDRPEPIAHRTSPTNLGLQLLSILAARDLGYTGLLGFTDRLERTLWNIAALERFRGHLYNWYETQGGNPIPPFYVSTVDSGNFAGHLIAIKQGCLELQHAPVFSPQTLSGLRDTLVSLQAELGAGNPWLRAECEALEQRLLEPAPRHGLGWYLQIESMAMATAALRQAVEQGSPSGFKNWEAVRKWAHSLEGQVQELQRDLDALMPWAQVLLRQPEPFGDGEPLVGDLSGRKFVFAHLVTVPARGPRGLFELSDTMARMLAEEERLRARLAATNLTPEKREIAQRWLDEVRAAFQKCQAQRIALLQRLDGLANLCSRLFLGMDFSFLYDPERSLFAVGYDVAEARLDSYHYDLLASECRLASFVAIAKGDVPHKHWFRMGRALTAGSRDRALVSWGGTMFEYLMPLLVMRHYEGTLLAQTLPSVVHQQIRYGQRERVPWGFSESGYSARDPQMNYQYRTFGVPGLGIRPDLHEDLVVAPYATLLALPVIPREAVRNLQTLMKLGLINHYGLYESVDYTPSRLPRGQNYTVVRELMAHHQGMSLVSVANFLLQDRMQERFHADPLVKSAELLLQERNPRAATVSHPQTQQVLQTVTVQREIPPQSIRHFTTPHTLTPRVQVLSNGAYSVMVTNAGGGFSRWRDLAVTRWREDATRDHWGSFVYLRDTQSGEFWSTAYQPARGNREVYDVYFTDDKAEFHRRVEGIVSRMEITVSPEDNAEIRRITLTNTTDTVREIEVTSYAEIVLAPQAADLAHSTFSNLFVETEYVPEVNALLATRRPRSDKQKRFWSFHVLAHEGVPAEIWDPTRWETDRSLFIGRGRTPSAPAAITHGELTGSTGPVLDPIFSLQQRVRIAPRATVQLAFAWGVAESREEALRLTERYRDLRVASRVFDLAWTHSQIQLRHLNLTPAEASLCQRLASRILYSDAFVRPPTEQLVRNTLTQSGLWAYGISGDWPIVLVQVSSPEHLSLLRELLRAHSYLRLKGLMFDLVILNEHPPSYIQSFEHAIQDLVRNEGAPQEQPGGVFLRRAELIPDAGRNLLRFVSRAVFSGLHGSLSDQLDWRPERKQSPEEFVPTRLPLAPSPTTLPQPELRFFNGLGGFSTDGGEYVILLHGENWPPAPWINVIANERFGFLASEAGSGYTWSENSRENRLTPWSNDPVIDPPGEVLYLRNEETGRLWTVTPSPIRESSPYVVRHGAGWTSYEHQTHGLDQELLLFTPPDDSVKLYRLRVRNSTQRTQSLSATFYAEWVLGVNRETTAPYVATSIDPHTGALIARNSYNGEFAHRVAFADVNRLQRTWTANRTEFLGRNGSLRRPRALGRQELSGAAGIGMDPCAALQVKFTIEPGDQTEIVFVLGEANDIDEARKLLRKYRNPANVEAALTAVKSLWQEILGTVQVATPDPALDLLLNRWLLYQVTACRVWARSAFYQSGGAYGFRDQLQDVMALIASGSATGQQVAREQILRHARHQFLEGDVQHWWHPPTGRGIRTRFSDDLLWLPLVTAYYVRVTGDTSILDEEATFLQGRPLADGEDEYYDQPTFTDETASLYEHCLRALQRGITTGEHGLPLMGTGDWNDGMNLVGNHGRGESVWVAWFLIKILQEFAPLAELRGETERAARLREQAEAYRQAVEENAWDGQWYRRAYFDDGTPLGSQQNEECQIDAIAQSWAIISGAGNPERARQAMEAVEQRLVREKDELILLFTPPFDKSSLNPGYIKGYVPGVRENGGQYTHAALWTVLATALMGKGKRAHELYSLLNPIRHGETPADVDKYKVEPYVVSADVYGVPPHTGRGGWTWYTGSASWMYRIGLETLLGFQRHADHLIIDPCIPAEWSGFQITYRHGTALYRIAVENPEGVEHGVRAVVIDGQTLPDHRIPLADDGQTHQVRVVLGRGVPKPAEKPVSAPLAEVTPTPEAPPHDAAPPRPEIT